MHPRTPHLINPTDVQHEHVVLVRMLACIQARMTRLATEHAQQLGCLQKEIMQLRAQLIMRDTALSISGGRWVQQVPGQENLQPFLEAADWVICRTGCISQGEYWREQNQCRRTGKTCVLVELDIPSPASGMAEDVGSGLSTPDVPA